MRPAVIWLLAAASAVLLSIPWLLPHTGYVLLVALFPLLVADQLASTMKYRHFWWCHYSCFVFWNAVTTFWVCNANVGGGIFAVVANAFQMSLIWALFRFSKKLLRGVLPYVFLAALWIAWEYGYFAWAEISWPWLVLGNAFATNVKSIQWYAVTGTLGGSLWVWCSNLALFGAWTLLRSGAWQRRPRTALAALVFALVLLWIGVPLCSRVMYHRYEERSERQLRVLVGQPNISIAQKFGAMSQEEQNRRLLEQLEEGLQAGPADLLIGPETVTADVVLNDIPASPTWQTFRAFLEEHPGPDFLWGAVTNMHYHTPEPPSYSSFVWEDGWREPHNTAIMLSADGRTELYFKSKLVPATEFTPYPQIFVPFDNWLSGLMKTEPIFARYSGQDSISLMHLSDGTPLGCGICYESAYGAYCADFASLGAGFLVIINNDEWWGNTPGPWQHCSFSILRAIETRRDLVRCGNSGISCFINQRGDLVSHTHWRVPASLRGTVNLNHELSFYTRHGDLVGRGCVLLSLLLLALLAGRYYENAGVRVRNQPSSLRLRHRVHIGLLPKTRPLV